MVEPGPPAGDPTDVELLAAHADGDPDAFGEIVRRHRDRLWAVALRTLGDREEAADAVQDALVSAFRAGRPARPAGESQGGPGGAFRGEAAVTTWLHRIVVNACLDRVRRRAVRPADPLPDRDLPGAGDQIAARETALDVAAALATLPTDQRAALVLVDMYGWSVQAAAEVLDCPVGTVKSRCARGRARLVPLLRSQPDPAPAGNPPPGDRVPPTAGDRTTWKDPTAQRTPGERGGEPR